MTSEKLLNISKEISKAEHIRDEAKANIQELKDQYRKQLVEECIENLHNVQEKEGPLSKRDMEIFIGHLAQNIRNLYIER